MTGITEEQLEKQRVEAAESPEDASLPSRDGDESYDTSCSSSLRPLLLPGRDESQDALEAREVAAGSSRDSSCCSSLLGPGCFSGAFLGTLLCGFLLVMVHRKEACGLHESQPRHSDGLLIDSWWTRDSLCRLLRGSSGNSTFVVSRDIAVAHNQHQQSPPPKQLHEQAHQPLAPPHPNRSAHNNSHIIANSSTTRTLHKRSEASEEPAAKIINADPTSLFCFMVVQPPPSYELEVAKYLLREGLGIFACEAWRVYSDRLSQPIALGSWAELPVETIPIPGPEAYYSTELFKHRLLFNADVFYRAWEHILKDGIYQKHAFTVKVDPDSVFMPHRLKAQLHSFARQDVPDVGRGKIFFNCPDFEAEGRAHIWLWEADISIKYCMLKLGVERLALFDALYDRDCPRPEFHWWVAW
ncbi:unnamed protein product [Polarella glacialis]|uniref:Uncharacterized protein n=1 Tax=Polarella glacialis TaxID=89957 RepID=A0A813HIM1_POLGL|nr:unnamed protein product [Polarella glacialis]